MNHILQIAALFLAQLGFGSAIIMPFMPIREVGKSFLRFYYGLIVIFLLLFLICLSRLGQLNTNYTIVSALAAWIWMLSFAQNDSKLEEYLLRIYAAFAAILLAVYAQKHLLHGFEAAPSLFLIVSLLGASVFLAFGLMNMIFGHWYLVNRSLPIVHLIKASRCFIVMTYLRIGLTFAAGVYAYGSLPPERFSRLIDFTGHGIFFWSRILAGLGVPLLVAHLSYQSAKIGANQSATGIMYAGTVFVLMGELMAGYLFSLTGILF